MISFAKAIVCFSPIGETVRTTDFVNADWFDSVGNLPMAVQGVGDFRIVPVSLSPFATGNLSLHGVCITIC
ncbi:hypothetical protein V2I52_21105 [Brenneria sp. g21c3]|uniref:hypothetical protein n=1 Tax=Brenneria sp. g21c3 TaxID=3093893 RepID=UPI002EBD6545|nr:hypothetical protein [Brenneria sp. g21c3]